MTATAVFTNKTYKLTIDSNAEFGSYTVTNQATNKEVKNGDLIPYGTKLTVKATPKEGYTPRVILNKVESKGTEDNEGVYTFSDLEIKKASTLEIFFEAAKEYSLSVQALEGYNLKLNGNEKFTKNSTNHKGYYVDQNNDLPKFQSGTKINLEMTKGSTKIKKILLNGSFVSSSSTAQFEMPASDSYITFETAELATIIVNGKDLETDGKTQKYTYDGEPHAFQYTVTPTGLTGFTVKYSKEGLVDNYQETVPTAVGTYKVLITRNADNSYAKYEKKDTYFLKIVYHLYKNLVQLIYNIQKNHVWLIPNVLVFLILLSDYYSFNIFLNSSVVIPENGLLTSPDILTFSCGFSPIVSLNNSNAFVLPFIASFHNANTAQLLLLTSLSANPYSIICCFKLSSDT